MASLISRDGSDGRFIGTKAVSSAGAWTDVALSSLDSSTGTALPAGVDRTLLDLLVVETSGEAPVYVLLRPHGTQDDASFTGAIMIPAGSGLPLSAYLPDQPITTVAVNGVCRLAATML